MKLLNKSIILFCLFFSITSYAQIKGKCVDTLGIGIAYVNISIKGKSIGTVSNQKGDFFLEHSSIKENDSLIFSHLNFNKKIVSIPLSTQKIELTPKVETLEEIVVSNKKRKLKIVGTKIEDRGDVAFAFTRKSPMGVEAGKIIKVRKNKVYDIKNMQFTIIEFGFKSATFRINFYNVIDGVVDLEKTNKTDLIYKIIDDGIVKIDLSKQDLSFSNNFLVSIEWIDLEIDDTIEKKWRRIFIPMANDTGPMCGRPTAHQKWKIGGSRNNKGLGIHLEVEQYSQ
ncbi:carboxypeptidase-like regulatory domain-containing protein [Hyunsoonleella rubra]|uniref:Carboxypeptidase-like regulatory domain-containing protein n=1 Tax=Hyunsoonleella rubra TaxID=1737062 RepID=A0ABW5T9R1_9FLAO